MIETWIEDARGPHGELYAPPLVGDLDPNEALARLVADSALQGARVDVPKRGHALEGLRNVALVYVHQLRLRDVLAGQCRNDTERALHQAVMVQGELLSLRPLGLEALTFVTFAPVLQHLGAGRWRIGLPEQGHCAEFPAADPAQALAMAQEKYVAWCAAEDRQFDQAMQPLLAATPPSLFHDFWLALLDAHETWNRGGGFRLTRLGHHNTLQLETPRQTRIIETDRLRGVRICDALARHAGVTPPYPTPGVFLAGLLSSRSSPDCPTAVQWSGARTGELARAQMNNAQYLLIRRERELLLVAVGQPRTASPLAVSAWEAPLDDWLTGEEGRAALLAWAWWPGRSQ